MQDLCYDSGYDVDWATLHGEVDLDDEAGRETAGIHPFLAHLDVLPAVVPIERGTPLDVVYGHDAEALHRAWAMLEA